MQFLAELLADWCARVGKEKWHHNGIDITVSEMQTLTFGILWKSHTTCHQNNRNASFRQSPPKKRAFRFVECNWTLKDTHTHTHTRTHTHTHTHTHVVFYGLRGLSIGVMVFILYKLYVLLPYTYPTPKLSPHRRRCISTFPPKNAHCMIYQHFKLWGHWKCPHKSPSPCNTYVIPMSLYKFVSS